jgi:hypothetical protein
MNLLINRAGIPETFRIQRVVSRDGSGGAGANGRTIGRSRQAEAARRQGDYSDGVTRHVEKLDRVAVFAHASNGMALHDRPNVADTQAALGEITGQDHVAVHFEAHAYLGYMVINRGRSVPVSTCQTEQNRTVLPLGVLIGPSIS